MNPTSPGYLKDCVRLASFMPLYYSAVRRILILTKNVNVRYVEFNVSPAPKYYARENDTHTDMQLVQCSKARVEEMVLALCVEVGVPPIQVRFHSPKRFKNRSSWYQPPGWNVPINEPTTEYLSFDEEALDCLVVAHEVAHYLHFRDYQHRREEFAIKHGPEERFIRENWHGPEHKRVVDQCVAFIKSKGWHLPPKPAEPLEKGSAIPLEASSPVRPASPVDAVPKTWLQEALLNLLNGKSPESLEKDEYQKLVAEVKKIYIDTLPEQLHCPKCQASKPREEFGARVMVWGAYRMPEKLARQSQCKTCRLKF